MPSPASRSMPPLLMGRLGQRPEADGKLLAVSDGNGSFNRPLGFGIRRPRKFGSAGQTQPALSLVVDNGVVKSRQCRRPGAFEVSAPSTILTKWLQAH